MASAAFSPHSPLSATSPDSAKGNTISGSADDVILAVGFESGVFGLWLLSHSPLSPPFVLIHVLSMSTHPLTATAVAPGGDWVRRGEKGEEGGRERERKREKEKGIAEGSF